MLEDVRGRFEKLKEVVKRLVKGLWHDQSVVLHPFGNKGKKNEKLISILENQY